jgi:pimeloyl-ACP methyl ester carboxylesterase
MSLNFGDIIIPRPGAPESLKPPISAPTEAAFTNAFGTLLPPAKYLSTENGRAAYYEIPPSEEARLNSCNRVLVIHGVQTPALGMLPLTRALQASFPTIHFVLVDLWGHGLSDTPIAPHEPSLFYQLLDDVLNKLEWPSVHLLGFSFGGATAVGYVGLRPSRIKTFTLIAPAGLIQFAKLTAEQQGYIRDGDDAAARREVVKWLDGDKPSLPVDWKERVGRGEIVAEAIREWQMREHPGHIASVAAIIRDGGTFDNDLIFLKAVRTQIPAFIVLGELDRICSREQLYDLGFENVAVVPNVGHEVPRQRVPEVEALIREFWSSPPPPKDH